MLASMENKGSIRFMIASGNGFGAADDLSIRLWTGKLIRKFDSSTEGVTAVAFSPDGRMLATANRNQTLTLWERFQERKAAADQLEKLGDLAVPTLQKLLEVSPRSKSVSGLSACWTASSRGRCFPPSSSRRCGRWKPWNGPAHPSPERCCWAWPKRRRPPG
jgi:WD40 repeat protein